MASLQSRIASLITQIGADIKFLGTHCGFSAYGTTTASIAANTATKIALTTEEYDTHGYYDASISRFQPLRAGYYLFLADVEMQTSTAGQAIEAYLYKNGVAYKRLAKSQYGGTANGLGVSGGHIAYMNGTTDYMELNVLTSATITLNRSSSLTYFTAAYLGS